MSRTAVVTGIILFAGTALVGCSDGGDTLSEEACELLESEDSGAQWQVPFATTLIGVIVDRSDLIVYIEPGPGADAIASELDGELRRDERVAETELVDQAATYDEFRELFANSAALIETVSPDDLPPSVRVILTDPKHVDDLVDELSDGTMIREVVTLEQYSARKGLEATAVRGHAVAVAKAVGDEGPLAKIVVGYQRIVDGERLSVSERDALAEAAPAARTQLREDCDIEVTR